MNMYGTSTENTVVFLIYQFFKHLQVGYITNKKLVIIIHSFIVFAITIWLPETNRLREINYLN